MTTVVETLAVKLLGDISDYQKKMQEASGSWQQTAAKMRGIGGAMTAATLAPLAAVGTGAAMVATQTDQAAADIAASLGIPIAASEEFAAVARDVYGNNFTDSVVAAGEAVAEVAKQFDLAADSPALQGITESALMLEDTFGVGVTESVAAAKQLMDDFGLSSQEAFDFLAAGYQRGLDSSGDFMDSVTEYSGQFANGGADAGQFFSILESGMQGGVLGTDKAADAFKEFRLRIVDGSDSTSAALDALGLSADEMTAAIDSGAMTTADAFALVVSKLGETDDASVRMAAGVGLLGTQFEDLGDSAVLGLSTSQTSMDDLAGSGDALNAKYETFGSSFEGMWRRITVAATPAVDKILEAGEQAMPAVESAITALVPVVEELAMGAANLVEKVVPWIERFTEMDSSTRRVIGVAVGLAAALGPVLTVVGMIIPLISAFGTGMGVLATVAGALFSPIGLVVGAVAGLAAVLFDWGGANEKVAATLASWGLEGVAEWVRTMHEGVENITTSLGDLFSGNMSFSEFFEAAVPDWISTLLSWAWPVLGPIAWVVKLTSWAWPRMSKPDWLERLLSFKWPGFPTLPARFGGGRDEEEGQNARGTSYWRGGRTWVGEEGPELVDLPRGAQVHDAQASASMANGPVTINVYANLSSNLDIHHLARRIGQEFGRA